MIGSQLTHQPSPVNKKAGNGREERNAGAEFFDLSNIVPTFPADWFAYPI
jgi:hypothetical protein